MWHAVLGMDADSQNKHIEALQAEIQTLREQLRQALQRIEELERAAHRQAAPFRRDPKKIVPPEQRKRPGRKQGHEGLASVSVASVQSTTAIILA